jgi:hypothetical protein
MFAEGSGTPIRIIVEVVLTLRTVSAGRKTIFAAIVHQIQPISKASSILNSPRIDHAVKPAGTPAPAARAQRFAKGELALGADITIGLLGFFLGFAMRAAEANV